jgi:hypothetical protein
MNLETRVERLESDAGIGQGEAWLHVAELLADGTYKMRTLAGVEHVLAFEQLQEIAQAGPAVVLDR